MRTGFVLFLTAAALTIAAIMAGCGGGGVGTNLPHPVIRFVNASPDSNPLDYFYDTTTKEASAIVYLGSSVDITVNHGDHDVSVQDSTTQTELDALAGSLTDDNKYIVFNVGLENFGSEPLKKLRLSAFQYDKNPPNGTKARLLILHAYMRSPGFDTPNIDFQGGAVATYDPNNPQFKVLDIPFSNNTPSLLEVDANVPLIFQARRAGTENVLASDPSTTFDSGGIYLAFVTGVEGEVGVEVPQVKYIKLN